MKLRYFSMSGTFGEIRGFFFLCMPLLAWAALPKLAYSQTGALSHHATIIVGSDTLHAHTERSSGQPNELAYALAWQHGYFMAVLEVAEWRTDTLFAVFGPTTRYRWGDAPVVSAKDSIDYAIIHSECDLSGQFYLEADLKSCVLSISDDAARQGYLSTTVVLDSLRIDDQRALVIAAISIHNGELATISEVSWIGLSKTGGHWLENVSGLHQGMVISQTNVQRAVSKINQTKLFEASVQPEVYKSDSGWGVSFAVQERPLTFFDLVVGYVPDMNGKAAIAGTGALHVRNAGFDGTDLSLDFDRQSERVGRLNIGLEQNRIIGLPFGVIGSFSLLRQDTLWQNRSTALGGWWEIHDNLRVHVGVNREVSTAASTAEDASDLWGTYGQFGISYALRDDVGTTSRGVAFTVMAESGRQIVEPGIGERFNQNRRKLSGRVDYHLPITPRNGLIPGMSAGTMITKSPQLNDLWRIGGTKSLRGYREDQFYVKSYLWGDLEYRFLLDAQSFLFVFGSGGWLWVPVDDPVRSKDERNAVRSIGFGLAFRTNLGQLKFTYAKSPEDPFSNAKVHVGLSSGF